MSNRPQSCDLGTEGVTRGQQAFPMKWTHPLRGSPGHGSQVSAGRSPGRMGRRWTGPAGAPRWPRPLPGQPPPWAAPREPCGRLSSLQTPGSEGGGEEGRHCCGFVAQEGTYLEYLGNSPTPPRLCLPALSHWNMPFTKRLHFLSVVGQVPTTLIESGKRGAGEGR